MDSILLVGSKDQKLSSLLDKLGYNVIPFQGEDPLSNLVHSNVLDMIVVDARLSKDGPETCEFLRTHEPTKRVPIIFLADDMQEMDRLNEHSYDRLQMIGAPFSLGALASKIATELRLSKFNGADELKSTLTEMNGRLRELNERFKKELNEAKEIQEGLLPEKLPNDPRYEMAVSYQPLEEVGGDWYFARKMPSGSIAVQIADVTGHGLSAAFIGSMTKLALAAAKKEKPDELLTEMNRLMAPQIPSGRFVTMCCYLFNPETGAVQFSRAGHPPALWYSTKTNSVTELKGEGFAVGFFEDSEYNLTEFTLEIGDTLLIYTDGISEAQNRSNQVYGTERLSNALKASSDKNCADILNGVLDDFDIYREERILKDDVTLVVLKRLA